MIRSLDNIVFLYLNGFIGTSPLVDAGILFCAVYLPFVIALLFVFSIGVLLYHRSGGLKVISFRFAEIEACIIGLVTVGVASLIALFVQGLYGRVRPYVIFQTPYLFTVSQWSFPSAHALILFALVGTSYRFSRKTAAILALLATVVCIARVAAGVHYPSDVLAGGAIGFLLGYLGVLIARYFR